MVLPLNAYPHLKEADHDGAQHVGWSLKVSKVEKGSVWLQEKGQSATKFSFAQVQNMVVVSV